MSFELSTQIVGNLPAIIINDEELKEELSEFVEPYKTIVFEDTKEAKKDLAMLRKLDKEIDDRKKAIKKEYMKHYDEFETRIKDLRAIVAEPISIISGKVNEFEEDRKAEKMKMVKEIFEEVFYANESITLEAIFKDHWLNATCNESAIRGEMQEIRLGVDEDLKAIVAIGFKDLDKVVDRYYQNGLCLSEAIKFGNLIDTVKAETEKELEIKKKRKFEVVEKSVEEILNTKIGFPGKDELEVRLNVICHKNKVYELMKLLYENGFEAERIME